MTPENFHYGRVGAPVPCCEIKLVDVPDTEYKSTNKPKPQGEVWVRGPSITAGYWKRDDETAETVMPDGWLRTGDVGELNKDGTLSIIDRAKNLVKLSNGEYSKFSFPFYATGGAFKGKVRCVNGASLLFLLD
jgi:long-chain acyl-CoA synthetase